MAHTERTVIGDSRPHPMLYQCGDIVGVYTEKGLATGKVFSTDAGGWIYVDWDFRKPEMRGVSLPGYLRSTHVVLVERAIDANL